MISTHKKKVLTHRKKLEKNAMIKTHKNRSKVNKLNFSNLVILDSKISIFFVCRDNFFMTSTHKLY